MNNRFYKQKFTTSKGETVYKYVWSQDIEDTIWPLDQDGFTMMPTYDVVGEAPSVGRMTVSQIQADRKQRSSQHFQKEIRPTLGSDEQIHFNNKSK